MERSPDHRILSPLRPFQGLLRGGSLPVELPGPVPTSGGIEDVYFHTATGQKRQIGARPLLAERLSRVAVRRPTGRSAPVANRRPKIEFGPNVAWAAVSMNEMQRLRNLTPMALAIFVLAYSRIDAHGHACFGQTLAPELARLRDSAPSSPSVSSAIARLKDAGLVAPESNRRCIVIYAEVAQRGAQGKKPCQQCGWVDRVWRSGQPPVRVPAGRTVLLAPSESAEITDLNTGEFREYPAIASYGEADSSVA